MTRNDETVLADARLRACLTDGERIARQFDRWEQWAVLLGAALARIVIAAPTVPLDPATDPAETMTG